MVGRSRLPEKDSVKSLNALNAKALNAIKLKLPKFLKTFEHDFENIGEVSDENLRSWVKVGKKDDSDADDFGDEFVPCGCVW